MAGQKAAETLKTDGFPYTIPAYASILQELLQDELKSDSCYLVGHSMGGIIRNNSYLSQMPV